MKNKRIYLRGAALAVLALLTLSAHALAQEANERGAKPVKLRVEVAHARIIFLSGSAADPGPDFTPGTADDDTAGPFFVVKGDIISVDGKPATGAFICRGVVFTSPSAPQDGGSHGVAQVNVTFDIDGRGILMGQSVEFRSANSAGAPGAVVGGTGDFRQMIGTFTPSGAPFPLSPDGKFTFAFQMQRVN